MLMTMSMVMHGWVMPMMMVVARMVVAGGIVHCFARPGLSLKYSITRIQSVVVAVAGFPNAAQDICAIEFHLHPAQM